MLRITCEPGSDVLEVVQSFLASYTPLCFRPALAERVCVAAYELLANGLTYGSVNCDVTFELLQRGSSVEVVVSNEAAAPRLRLLTAHIEKLRAGAEATYLEELKRAVTGGGPRAMLGLARVVHEAQMGLDVAVQGETSVTVRARSSR